LLLAALIITFFFLIQSELWGKYNILVTGGSDGENRDSLLSFSIVPVESQFHYEWHMANEQKHADLREKFLRLPLLVVPSDRKKGLMNSVDKMLPDCAPRHCARHLIGNLPDRLKNASYNYEGTYWSIVYAESEPLFKLHMCTMSRELPNTHKYLSDNKPYEEWTDYNFPTFNWNERTNNLSEHAVNWIGEEVRKKSALVICRIITAKLAKSHFKRRTLDLQRQKQVFLFVFSF
jgi:hypothetical protein